MTTLHSKPVERAVTPAAASVDAPPCRGYVEYLFAFDIAYDTRREPIASILGQSVAEFAVDVDRRSPREALFYRPLTARLGPLKSDDPAAPTCIERTIKFFPVGALSVAIRVPFEGRRLGDLVALHDSKAAQAEALRLAELAMAELSPRLIRPMPAPREEEAYTIFCLEADGASTAAAPLQGAGVGAEAWLAANRRAVAALLLQEDRPETLSEQEIEESTGKHVSYYEHDLVVVDWDAALVIDRPGQFAPTLHIMELANVQLAELKAYDRILDEALPRAYQDLAKYRLGRRPAVVRTLRDFRIDMARLSDELSNAAKFFGDWHLARVYRQLSDRFHLEHWRRTIESKVGTLDDLYAIVKQDQMNFGMMVLEATIVVLFILDLIVLVMVGG
jgi:hypothetical protein